MQSHIVFYSRTGTTRLLAEALAARTLADRSEIRCSKYGAGLLGWLSAGRDSWRAVRPTIDFDRAKDMPDCLIVGSPVWSGTIAAPVRSYLAQLDGPPKRIGMFLTSGGEPPHPKAEAEVMELLGRDPDGWLILTADDVRQGRHMDEIEDFLRDLTHTVG